MNIDKRHEMTLGGATITVRRRDHVDHEGRRQYSWRIQLADGRTFKARDLWTGANGFGDNGARAMTGTLLSFLGAFAEAQDYRPYWCDSENRNLFPKGLREWATQNSDEIAMAGFEIENPEPEPEPHIVKARQMGTERGKAAASWVFDGNTTQETYRAFLQATEDGDPARDQWDHLSGWLSGEYGDDPRPQTLAHDLDLPTDTDDDMAAVDEACDAYEDAAEEAYWAELERVARLQTGGDE